MPILAGIAATLLVLLMLAAIGAVLLIMLLLSMVASLRDRFKRQRPGWAWDDAMNGGLGGWRAGESEVYHENATPDDREESLPVTWSYRSARDASVQGPSGVESSPGDDHHHR